MQHDYKMKKTMRCFKSKENAKRVLFFLLARIDGTEDTKRALQERYTLIQTHGTRLCAWYFRFCFCSHVSKSNLHYTRGITPKRVTSGEVHLRCLAPGQHSSEGISQWWRAIGDTADLAGPVIEPQTSRTDGTRLTTVRPCTNRPLYRIAMYRWEKMNWIVLRAKHQREGFYH